MNGNDGNGLCVPGAGAGSAVGKVRSLRDWRRDLLMVGFVCSGLWLVWGMCQGERMWVSALVSGMMRGLRGRTQLRLKQSCEQKKDSLPSLRQVGHWRVPAGLLQDTPMHIRFTADMVGGVRGVVMVGYLVWGGAEVRCGG